MIQLPVEDWHRFNEDVIDLAVSELTVGHIFVTYDPSDPSVN